MMSRWQRLAILLSAALALVLPAPVAAGGDDDDEVARAADCTRSSSGRLTLRKVDDDGGDSEDRIRLTFTVRTNRIGVTWNVILLYERRITYRGALRTRAPAGTLLLQRALPDWYGSKQVAVRATSASGEVCRASARL